MKIHTINRFSLRSLGILVIVLGAIIGTAPYPRHMPSEDLSATREHLAMRHEKMAACLRSDKPLSECDHFAALSPGANAAKSAM